MKTLKVTIAVALLAAVGLTGCVPSPGRYTETLPENDPKWDTPECQEIRMAALNFDEKIGQRFAIGLASGLLLGPLGIIPAAAADAEQNERRRHFARELHMRCSSLPLPENLQPKPPKKPDETGY